MIPNRPLGQVRPEVAKVFNSLRKIPGEDFECRYDMSFGQRTQPEFLVLYRREHAFLLAVSPLSRGQAEDVVQGSIFADEASQPLTLDTFGVATTSTLREFWEMILRAEGVPPERLAPVQRIVLFPNVPQRTLDQIAQLRPVDGHRFWGKETTGSERLSAALAECAQTPACDDLIQLLRASFDPSTVIPESFTPRPRVVREVDAKLTARLLDLDQEQTAKLDLALSDEARETAGAFSTRLVTGVAGSGKTLVLLYRAMYCAQLQRGARILVLTHNKALNHDLRARAQRLCPEARFTQSTFLAWCRQHFGPFTIIYDSDRFTLLKELLVGESALQGLGVEFVRDELEWLMDNAITSREAYLDAPRTGRGRKIGPKQREAIHALFRRYRETLQQRGLEDWSAVPLRLLRRLESGELSLPPHDFIFVDEAQFFAPVWFEVIKRALSPQGQLFLAADPTQGFLKRRQSWRASGLDVVGRSTRLTRPYRNTRQILAFAVRFYRSRLSDTDDEDLNLPNEATLALLPEGPEPEVVDVGSAQDQLTRLEREVAAYVEGGGKPGHLLVITGAGSQVKPVLARLQQKLGPTAAIEATQPRQENQLRVGSINAITGLEAPIVFLLGLKTLLQIEQDLALNAEDRADLIRDNTRRCYVAMTRATQRLVVLGQSKETELP